VTLNLAWVQPETGTALDLDAARRCDGLANRLFLDPILHGRYPVDVVADTAEVTRWRFVQPADMDTIGAPLDVLGLNYYSPLHVRHWTRERPRETADGHGEGAATPWIACDDVEFPRRAGPTTAMGWGINSRGLTELLVRVARERPDLEFVVTENGAAFPDVVGADGIVHDDDRVAYLCGHLAAVHPAIAAGVRVTGYCVWSLLDNFEWAWGYGKCFGIVHVDYATLERTPKDSARFYARVVRDNAVR
jgi:beta-glucosidase